MINRPLIQYPGSKFIIADQIIKHFPAHRTYTEVFAGSAAILMQKNPSFLEIINDIDQELYNLFRQLQNENSAEKIAYRLRFTPFSRDECARAFEPTEDEVERACRLIVRSYMSRNLKGAYFRRPSVHSWGTRTDVWQDYPNMLYDVYMRLRNVTIENRPANEVLKMYDSKDTLHYVDSPYIQNTRQSGLYLHEMESIEEHTELLNVVLSLKGMVIMSGYANSLYDEMLPDWTQVIIPTRADGGGEREEILYISPNIPKTKQTSFLT